MSHISYLLTKAKNKVFLRKKEKVRLKNKCTQCGYIIGEDSECMKCKFESMYWRIDLRKPKDKHIFEQFLNGETI